MNEEEYNEQVNDDIQVVGINACRALIKRRSEDICRAWLTEETKEAFKDVMGLLAERRMPYEIVETSDLDKLTEGTHHEGICLVTHPKWEFTAEEFLERDARSPCCIVALDGISNPHNLGAILRVAAHYGVFAVMVSEDAPIQSGAVFRTAEGGAECVVIIRSDNFRRDIRRFQKAEFEILVTSSHGGVHPHATRFPARFVLILGSERDGVQETLINISDLRVCLPGTGLVESLNVATAASAILTEFYRQHLLN